MGHLYRGIEQGFRRLVEKHGEHRVFVGPPEAQATWRYFWWPELVPVTDLASAQAAIGTIVEQGEGAQATETTPTSACFSGSWWSTSNLRSGIRTSSRRDR